MSKTILTNVDGFTPLPDLLVARYGVVTATIWGVAWRFCQMSDGVCRTSMDKIAERAGVSRQTALKHIGILVKDGFFEDKTPDLKNKPHTYRDTGKVGMYNRFGIGVKQIDSTVNLVDSTVKQIDSTVNEIDSHCQLDVHEDSIKDTEKEREEEKKANANSKISPLIEAEQLLCNAAGLSALPYDFRDRLETVLQLIDTYGEKETSFALRDARSEWIKNKRKDNARNYSVLNPTWIDWAIAHLAGESPWKEPEKKVNQDVENTRKMLEKKDQIKAVPPPPDMTKTIKHLADQKSIS